MRGERCGQTSAGRDAPPNENDPGVVHGAQDDPNIYSPGWQAHSSAASVALGKAERGGRENERREEGRERQRGRERERQYTAPCEKRNNKEDITQ